MEKLKSILSLLLQTAIITAIVLVGVIPFSCKVSTEGIEIIGGDYSPPTLNNITVVDEKTIVVDFSEPVTLSNVVVSPVMKGYSDSVAHSSTEDLSVSIASAIGEFGKIDSSVVYSDDSKVVTVNLSDETEVGRDYELFGVVSDAVGNTLTFCMPFIGYNSNVPMVILTEVQIKYGKGSVKGETVYRGEYVEILALEDGNLAGLELVSGADGEGKKFVFPAVNVQKNEVFLVHLRTVGDGCVSEIEDNLSLATAPHSKDGVRDLWATSTIAHFNDSSDVVILRNSVNGQIIDALMYAAEGMVDWKSGVADYAVEVAESGVYNSSDISCVTSSKGATTLKSFTRMNVEEVLEIVSGEDEFEYPFVSDEDSWAVMPVTPGEI